MPQGRAEIYILVRNMFNERRAANRQSARAVPPNNERASSSGRERDTRITREGDRSFKSERRYRENYRQKPSEYENSNKRHRPDGGRFRSDGRSGYYDSNYSQQNYGHGQRYSGRGAERGNARGRNDSVPVQALESFKMADTEWDKFPPRLKGMSARFAKSAGVFSSRSDSILDNLTDSNIESLIKQQENLLKMRNSRLDTQRILGPTESKLSKQIIVKGIDFSITTPQSVQKYFESFLASVVIPDVSYEELALTTEVEEDKLLVDCATSLVATTLMSFHSKYITEIEATPIIERPHDFIEVIETKNSVGNNAESETEEPEVLEQISETAGLCCVNNIPEEITNGKFKEILHKYGNLHSAVLLIGKVTYECCGVAFFSFRDTKKPLQETLKDIADEEKWNCFPACKNNRNHYFQKGDINVANIRDFIDTKTKDISKHQSTSTIQLLNGISVEDSLDSAKCKQVKDVFEEELSQMNGFEKLVLVTPTEGFRIQQIDEVQPEFGRVLVSFKTPKDAETCLNKICGRYFHGRVIIGGFLDDSDYKNLFVD